MFFMSFSETLHTQHERLRLCFGFKYPKDIQTSRTHSTCWAGLVQRYFSHCVFPYLARCHPRRKRVLKRLGSIKYDFIASDLRLIWSVIHEARCQCSLLRYDNKVGITAQAIVCKFWLFPIFYVVPVVFWKHSFIFFDTKLYCYIVHRKGFCVKLAS